MTPADGNNEERWEIEDGFLVGALRLVQEKKDEQKKWFQENHRLNPEIGVDPRFLRIKLGADFETSRTIFQHLQALGKIDAAGLPILTKDDLKLVPVPSSVPPAMPSVTHVTPEQAASILEPVSRVILVFLAAAATVCCVVQCNRRQVAQNDASPALPTSSAAADRPNP